MKLEQLFQHNKINIPSSCVMDELQVAGELDYFLPALAGGCKSQTYKIFMPPATLLLVTVWATGHSTCISTTNKVNKKKKQSTSTNEYICSLQKKRESIFALNLQLFSRNELRTECSQPTSQQYFPLTPNQHQPSVTSKQYFSLTTNQHHPPATPSRIEMW